MKECGACNKVASCKSPQFFGIKVAVDAVILPEFTCTSGRHYENMRNTTCGETQQASCVVSCSASNSSRRHCDKREALRITLGHCYRIFMRFNGSALLESSSPEAQPLDWDEEKV